MCEYIPYRILKQKQSALLSQVLFWFSESAISITNAAANNAAPLASRLPLTQLIPYSHTFTIVSLLLALMADLCLPLSAGEDTFELHSVQLETVEKQIGKLLGKQAQLRERRATLETSLAEAHKSGVGMQHSTNTPTTYTPCFSAQVPCTRVAIFSDVLHSGVGKPQTLGASAEDPIQAPGDDFSPSAVFEIFNRFAPLRETERNAVIVAEGKVHTHCFPGARVLDVSAQIPAIMKDDGSVTAVVIDKANNDTKLRQTETLKRDFRSLIEMVCSTSTAATIVSGPLPHIDEDTEGSVDCLL